MDRQKRADIKARLTELLPDLPIHVFNYTPAAVLSKPRGLLVALDRREVYQILVLDYRHVEVLHRCVAEDMDGTIRAIVRWVKRGGQSFSLNCVICQARLIAARGVEDCDNCDASLCADCLMASALRNMSCPVCRHASVFDDRFFELEDSPVLAAVVRKIERQLGGCRVDRVEVAKLLLTTTLRDAKMFYTRDELTDLCRAVKVATKLHQVAYWTMSDVTWLTEDQTAASVTFGVLPTLTLALLEVRRTARKANKSHKLRFLAFRVL